jgi:hypothetical protein
MCKGRVRIELGDPVVAPRRVIALPTDAEQRQRLLEISRSRTEPTSRVETGADHSGLFAGPVGLCGGAHDWGDAADSDIVSVFAAFERAAYTVTKGKIINFRSSPRTQRGFRARCGSTLTCESDRFS